MSVLCLMNQEPTILGESLLLTLGLDTHVPKDIELSDIERFARIRILQNASEEALMHGDPTPCFKRVFIGKTWNTYYR